MLQNGKMQFYITLQTNCMKTAPKNGLFGNYVDNDYLGSVKKEM